MKKLILFTMIAGFGLSMLGLADNVDARRFGGGMSFGKHRSITPPSRSRTFNQRQATPQRAGTAGQRGGARTGMMGMLGGLALGGLLGSMFFGGAFEGINLFDILMIGGIIALIMMFLRKRAPAQQPSYAGSQSSSAFNDHQGFSTNGNSDHDASINDAPNEPVGTALRPEIDAKQFIPAAKEIYVRMQKAWDNNDIDDIHKFCTPEIAERIGLDMKPGETNITEVATLNAEIADAWIESDLEWVAVNYTAMLREQKLDNRGSTLDGKTTEVNEVWIFRHAPESDDPTWYLAGIQQAG